VSRTRRYCPIGLAALLCILAWLFLPAEEARSAVLGPAELWAQGEEALERGQLAFAERIAEQLEREGAEQLATYFRARVELYSGDYVAALDLARRLSGVAGGLGEAQRAFLELVATTERITQPFRQREPRRFGRFTVFVANDRDAVLLDYLETPLRRIDEALTEALGAPREGEVRLEVYPTVDDFIAVSTLSRQAVDTTGTLALCKFNRMMIVSPAALLRGYSWLDTISHEFIHFLIVLRTGYAVPIWLHEGIARYYQGLWRGPAKLDQRTETVLAELLQHRDFVPFGKMHPSMALLDSADEVDRAFAQVAFTVHALLERWGKDAVATLLGGIAAGGSLESELHALTGMKLDRFERWVQEQLPKFGPKRRLADRIKTRFRIGKETADEEEDERPLDERVEQFLRLGDLLRDRGHDRPALQEYAKADKLAARGSAKVLRKMALCQMELKQGDEALRSLEAAAALEVASPTVHLLLGQLLLERGRLQESRASLLAVLDQNPFLAQSHRLLAEVHTRLGRPEEAAREQRNAAVLER